MSLPLRLFGVFCLLFSLFPLGSARGASAPESVSILNFDGKEIFRLDFFGEGLPYLARTGSGGDLIVYVSASDFSLPVREGIVKVAAYWADILKPRGAPANAVTLRLWIGPGADFNGGSIYLKNPADFDRGSIWSSIVGDGSPLTASGLPHDPLIGMHALVNIDNSVWDTQSNSNLPETAGSISLVTIHEIGHSIGISDNDQNFRNLLVGAPGEMFFTGPTATQVFGGPVPMTHGSSQETSHFAVRNGLMTHLQLINYSMFTEVELASLVDIGYPVDLRNFFGLSLYDDSPSPGIIENNQGFYASEGLDPAGGWLGYAEGTPNVSRFGVGLHVYGSDYGVTQMADLLADGAGGAGVRVDGFNNSVTIPKDTLVTANGAQGAGILVSFGSGHNIVSQGVVEASGPLGVGARFDFGAPSVYGRLFSYGRYYLNPNAVVTFDAEGREISRVSQEPRIGNIGGPLVDSFDLSGVLVGGPSAIGGQYFSGEFVDYGGRPIAMYVSPYAHVKTVNVMNGAFIFGDIVIRWAPEIYGGLFGDPSDFMTELTFGKLMDSFGKAIPSSSDPAFETRYRGDILGSSSVNVSLEGGSLDYAGSMRVRSFSMADGARLMTEFVGGKPTEIAASDSASLSPLSEIGFAPCAFSYGRQLALGGSPALEFTLSAPVAPPLRQSAGAFAMGAFDYAWNGLDWDANLHSVMVNVTRAAFNHQRGGADALNAPLPILMRQPGLNAVSSRMGRRFSDAAARGPLSPRADGPFEDEKSFSSRWSPLAGSGWLGQVYAFRDARPGAPSAGGQSRDGGGLDAASRRNGVWIAPAYGFLKHGGDRDYTIFGSGVTFGVDRYFADNLYLGLALSLDFPRYESSDADVDGRGANAIFYGGVRLPRGLELGFVGAFGGARFKQTRAVGGNSYDSDYDAKMASVGVSLGRRFEISENFMILPFADWRYFNMSRDSYSERPDVYGLRFDHTRNRLYRLQAGLEGAWVTERGGIGAKAYWSGLSGDTKKSPSASFALDPEANRFYAPVDGLDENSLGLGLNCGVRLGAHTELRLEYSLLRGKTTSVHEGTLGLNFIF
ncbi:MAG: autotransporter domain-containing protein [Deltaproteobacteria bacterium]|jgi:hypothetical protein|nr:autotransporter domain-containing protein [Deltaproteobacteria bacterium]